LLPCILCRRGRLVPLVVPRGQWGFIQGHCTSLTQLWAPGWRCLTSGPVSPPDSSGRAGAGRLPGAASDWYLPESRKEQPLLLYCWLSPLASLTPWRGAGGREGLLHTPTLTPWDQGMAEGPPLPWSPVNRMSAQSPGALHIDAF
jgi:hypothetical protein